MNRPLILHVETATPVCSIAVSQGNSLLSLVESHTPNSHSGQIAEFMAKACEEAGISAEALDAVAVSKGPGSYTGLRIGVSAAKGLCFAIHKPLLAVSTLEAMAWALAQTDPNGDYYLCPMLDARRMEVYCGIWTPDGREIYEIDARIIDAEVFTPWLDKKHVLFFGNGADKCREHIQHPNARFITDWTISARGMISIAKDLFLEGKFEDLAYFEPYYLKDFIAGKPKVKGLR